MAARIDAFHREGYEELFGPLPDVKDAGAQARILANVGKAIAAFVRTIEPGASRFDLYAEAILTGNPQTAATILEATEIRGLRLFLGKARCTNCHAGPLFTNGEFVFSRVPQKDGKQDGGRGAAIELVKNDEFRCTGAYSDAKPEQCSALRFLVADARDAMHAFKTPSLRNVALRAPYMHAGQLATVGDVLRFYRDSSEGIVEMSHGDLTDSELDDLEAFLKTLTGPIFVLGEYLSEGPGAH